MRQGELRRFGSIAVTLAVIVVLMIAAPANAILLTMTLPATGDINSHVDFDVKLDIENGEAIPIDDVTLIIDGPSGEQECVFSLDGTPISGCDGLLITPTDGANKGFFERYGYGFNGSDTFNTTFGYGYGYGYGAVPYELVWSVKWDTTSKVPGDYHVDFFIKSSSVINERTYNVDAPGIITLDGSGAAISIKSGFPQENNYVFVCDAIGFEAESYNWEFGDGQKLLGVENDNVWHTFSENGIYEVSCTAQDDKHSETSSMIVNVGGVAGSADLFVAPFFPQDNNYVLVCDVDGFTPSEYDWHFGDGQKLLSVSNMDVYHTYLENGVYDAMCVGRYGEQEAVGNLEIDVTGAPHAELVIKDGFPQGGDHVLVCENNIGATTFDWDFGDGQKLYDVENMDVFHNYAPGEYTAFCQAQADGATQSDWLSIIVE